MNTSRTDAPLDASTPEGETAEAEARAVAPPRPAGTRALWPGSPTPALTYPDPPARPNRPTTGA